MKAHYVVSLFLISFLSADVNANNLKFPVTNDLNYVIHHNHLTDFFRKVSKCCPVSSTYNPSKRICVPFDTKQTSKWKLISHMSEAKQPIGAPVCGENGVLADYEVIVTVNPEGEILETVEGSGGTENTMHPETSCENGVCDGLMGKERRDPLEYTDGDIFLGDLRNETTTEMSMARSEREIKINSAYIDDGISNNATFSNHSIEESPTFFLPDGTLRIGTEDHRTDEFCIDVRDERENSIKLTVRVCESFDRWCNGSRACVRKCCLDGESMLEWRDKPGNDTASISRMCGKSTLGFQIQKVLKTKTPIGIIHGVPCGPDGKYSLRPEDSEYDNWELKPDGSLILTNLPDGPEHIGHTGYCLERVYSPTENMDQIYAYVCFPEPENQVVSWINGCALSVSCFFLGATLVAYTLLPLRNLHGVTLVSHASCLLVAFLCLATAKFTESLIRGMVKCKVLGFSLQFSFLAAFSWLNVMCFDIWWTFGMKGKGPQPNQRGGSGKAASPLQGTLLRYICYSLYAWLVPLTITALTVLADDYGKGILPYATPQIGEVKCWFVDDGGWAVVIHFLGPSTILLGADAIMFTITAVRCWQIKTEIQRMQRSDKEDTAEVDGKKKFGRRWLQQTYRADKERLTMTLKLCAAMGINWSTEIMSWWFSRGKDKRILLKAIWYLTDLANCFHGVFVFVIFVGKRKVLVQLWKKIKDLFGCCPKGIAGHEDRINRQEQNSYNTSSIQDNSAAVEGRTYNFDDNDGRKISRIRGWLRNHGIYSRQKRTPHHHDRYLSKMSTTTTSISGDMSQGNFSHIP